MYSSEHHGYILCSEQGKLQLSIQLLPRRVAVAAGAVCWAPSTQALGHREGSVTTVSCSHAVKVMIHMHLNGEFYHFLAKQLENNSVSIGTSVVTVCDQRGDPRAHRVLTSTLTDTVPLFLSSCLHTKPGILYIKCNTVNRPPVTHRK